MAEAPRRNLWLIGCVGALLVVLLLVAEEHRIGVGRFVLHAVAGGVRERLHRMPFSSPDWKRPAFVASNGRIRMVDDLLKRHRLVGMTKPQVLRLLGRPDSIYGVQFHYYLGPERGPMGIDAEVLELTFDRSGKVISARVSTT